MMELYSLSRALKSDFTTDIYCLNTMCDQPKGAIIIQTLLVPDRRNGAFFIFQVHKALFSTPGAKRRYLRFFKKVDFFQKIKALFTKK